VDASVFLGLSRVCALLPFWVWEDQPTWICESHWKAEWIKWTSFQGIPKPTLEIHLTWWSITKLTKLRSSLK
jgi:hypothetical protein